MSSAESEISERLANLPIAHYFPVSFENGVSLSEMVMACKACNSVYPQEHLCGSVTQTTPSEILIEAAGNCQQCHAITSFDIKAYDDRSFGVLNEHGEWMRFQVKKVARARGVPDRDKTTIPQISRHDRQMAKIGTIVMALRLGWMLTYFHSVWPAIQEIQAGAPNTFTGFFLLNGLLIAVAYVSSVILTVNYFRK